MRSLHTVRRRLAVALLAAAALTLGACAPQSRLGMVVDPETGLQMGSVVERTFVVTPAQFHDPRLRLQIRNVSGDPAFDLKGFRAALEDAYRAHGYEIAGDGDYGLLLDVAVSYSGQTTENLAAQFSTLGAAGGGLGAYAATRGGIETAAGVLVGATLGHVIGTYQREETFIVVAKVTFGVMDQTRGTQEDTLTFGKSGYSRYKRTREYRGFRARADTEVTVYAGGHNITQGDIAARVRDRFHRILQDII